MAYNWQITHAVPSRKETCPRGQWVQKRLDLVMLPEREDRLL